MATPENVNALSSAVLNIKSIEPEKILRPALGEASLEEFSTELEKFIKKGQFAVQYASEVADSQVSQAVSIFNQIFTELDTHSKKSTADYVTTRDAFLTRIKSFQEQLRSCWPYFVTSAVESRGFLEDEGIRSEYQNAVSQMETQAKETLKEVQVQAEKTITEAKKLAGEIEGKARQTATKISVKDAQEQFKNAQPTFNMQVNIWAGISILMVIIFIIFAIYFANHEPDSINTNIVIFNTAIRITILTAIGASATFCLRIFRAQMHMKEQNLHRQRIANSISSFVESAGTPEQRDAILAQLVSAVIAFGNSGLLSESDDAISPAKFTIDSIAKNITLQGK